MNTHLEADAIERIKPLCGPLQEAISFGSERAALRMEEDRLQAPEHDWLRHHWARVVAGQWLRERADEISPWRPLPNLKTGSLQLVRGSSTIRVLRGIDGQAPPPGSNRARRAFYAQPTLTGLHIDDALPGLEASNFIATWQVVDRAAHAVAVRLFRTIGAFGFGAEVKADLAFWLPDAEDDLNLLTFDPSDEGIELPIGEEQSGDEPVRG